MRTQNFDQFHGIMGIQFERGVEPDEVLVHYSYQNIDMEYDDEEINAKLLVDPDDDGNYLLDNCLIYGKIMRIERD
jgi:hypothetical protein